MAYLFIRLAVLEVSPFVVAWGRITLAALVLVPIAWHRGALRGLGAHRAAVCVFALVEFAIPFSAVATAERWIPSSIAGILLAAAPLTITVISRFFGVHERLGPWRLLGLLIGLAGVAVLLGFGTIAGARGWIGFGLVLFATVGYASGALIIQRHFHQVDPLGPVAGSLTVASLLLLLPAAASFPTHMPSAAALSSIAVLGLVCTAFAMLVMFSLIRHVGAARAAIVTYINPAVAALLGVGILREHLGAGGVPGIALIVLGSWLATRGRPKSFSAPSSLERSETYET